MEDTYSWNRPDGEQFDMEGFKEVFLKMLSNKTMREITEFLREGEEDA
jgi:hypothetical protein